MQVLYSRVSRVTSILSVCPCCAVNQEMPANRHSTHGSLMLTGARFDSSGAACAAPDLEWCPS